MKSISIKVVSDVVCSNLFKNTTLDNGFIASFDISPVDQFIPEIIKSKHFDFLVVHLSEFSFNVDGPTQKYIENLDLIINELIRLIKNSSARVLINTVAFNCSYSCQEDLILFHQNEFKINNKIISFASENPSQVILINVKSVMLDLGIKKNINVKNYYVMRYPYSKEMTENLRSLYKFHLNSVYQVKKKIIFVDADNTLWGGVVGEDGVHGIKIGYEYPGYIYTRFQQILLSLKNGGALLCLITKNNDNDILEVFAEREMPLKATDFIKIKASWDLKSKSIREVLDSLNLDVASALFIDDSKFEISEVVSQLENLEFLNFNINNFDVILDALYNSTSFYRHYITIEDKNKTDNYIQEEKRSELMATTTTVEDYLNSLNIVVTVSRNCPDLIPRISQLTQKTNQFNLTTRRYSVSEIAELMSKDTIYSFSVKDKFGDMGVVGVVIIVDDLIDTFLLSCRAFGRQVESTMLNVVLKDKNIPLFAEYIPTRKNVMTKNFYIDNGFELVQEKIAEVQVFKTVKAIDVNNSLMELVWR